MRTKTSTSNQEAFMLDVIKRIDSYLYYNHSSGYPCLMTSGSNVSKLKKDIEKILNQINVTPNSVEEIK